MCRVRAPKVPKQSAIEAKAEEAPIPKSSAAPTKTGADIQREAERERMALGFSRYGFTSLILTGGDGDPIRAAARQKTAGGRA